jgi:hypothetical protein
MSAQGREIEQRRLPVLAVEIGQEVRKAEEAWRDAVGHAINAGEKLIEAKSLVKHGEWLPWLATNFPGSERTARLYMQLAANSATVADLPTVREAVALLAGPKQPEPVELDDDEAIEREVAGRLAALHERNGGLPANAHVATAALLLVRGQVVREHLARLALTLASEHLAAGQPELASAATHVATTCFANPWDEDGDAASEWDRYQELRDGSEA